MSKRPGELPRALVYVGVIALLSAFYAFVSYDDFQSFTWPNGGWYGELARAFHHGQVSLLSKPSAGLLADPNPYGTRHDYPYKWDVSYYHGKYYLYFGPGPTVLFFLPWLMVTGQVLNQALVYWFLSVTGLILFGLFLSALVERYFPDAPLSLQAMLLLLFGLGCQQAVGMHMVLVYMLAATTAATFLLAMFYSIFRALHSTRCGLTWLVVASLCWGLSVSARANMILYGVVFPPALYFLFKELPVSAILMRAIAVVLPPAAIGLLLAWYNQARFGSPLNFGLNYQLSSLGYASAPRYSISYVPMNLIDFIFMPPRPIAHFPWLIADPPNLTLFCPGISSGPYQGLLFSLPILCYGLLWPRLLRDQHLRFFSGVATLGALVLFLQLLLYFYMTQRYFLDFLIPLFLLTTMCLLTLGYPPRRPLGRSLLYWVALGWSFYQSFTMSYVGLNIGTRSFQTYPPPPGGALWIPDGEQIEPH